MVYAQIVPAPTDGFQGSGAHGILSEDLDPTVDAFIFEGDFLGCENGWRGFRNSCYNLPRGSGDQYPMVTWNEAVERCNSQNAQLVSIDDQAENDFLFSYMQERKGLNHAWIGLTPFFKVAETMVSDVALF